MENVSIQNSSRYANFSGNLESKWTDPHNGTWGAYRGRVRLEDDDASIPEPLRIVLAEIREAVPSNEQAFGVFHAEDEIGAAFDKFLNPVKAKSSGPTYRVGRLSPTQSKGVFFLSDAEAWSIAPILSNAIAGRGGAPKPLPTPPPVRPAPPTKEHVRARLAERAAALLNVDVQMAAELLDVAKRYVEGR